MLFLAGAFSLQVSYYTTASSNFPLGGPFLQWVSWPTYSLFTTSLICVFMYTYILAKTHLCTHYQSLPKKTKIFYHEFFPMKVSNSEFFQSTICYRYAVYSVLMLCNHKGMGCKNTWINSQRWWILVHLKLLFSLASYIWYLFIKFNLILRLQNVLNFLSSLSILRRISYSYVAICRIP